MARLVLSENVSLDGVVQDPTGEEGFRHGGWFTRVTDADRAEWLRAELAEAQEAEAILLGRRSYDFFAARWPDRTGPFADRLRELPKFVVSAGLAELPWHNSTVLTGDPVESVGRLKDEHDGMIVLYASQRLVRTLWHHDLIDEVRLMVYPCVLGSGRRLFEDLGDLTRLRLLDVARVGDSLVHLRYDVVR